MDQHVPPDPVERLREVLAATTADIPKLEAAVTAAQATVTSAQERLRRQLAAAEKIRDALGLLEVDEAQVTATQLPLPPDGIASPDKAVVEAQWRPRGNVVIVEHGIPFPESKKARMIRTISDLLALRGSVHRTKILQRLIEAGIMGGERDPLAHLAAFLSNEKDKFASDGAGNFSLRQQSVAVEPPSVPTGAEDTGVGADAAQAAPTRKRLHEKEGFHEPATQR
jgi:hypothetical protein